VVIAIAVALRPPILLLDEPTSALDPESAKLAEAVFKASGSACVWVSHDPAQPGRVGGRVLDLPAGVSTWRPVFVLAQQTACPFVLKAWCKVRHVCPLVRPCRR
jgi:ABC-type sulfate/molybdate transport systems ATPase subunit